MNKKVGYLFQFFILLNVHMHNTGLILKTTFNRLNVDLPV